MGLRQFGADRAVNNGDDDNDYVAHQGRCRVFDVVASYSGAAKVYLQLHDLAAQPANGAKPLAWAELDNSGAAPALHTGSLSWAGGRVMQLGIFVAISSTPDTFTTVAGNDTIFDVTLNNYP